MILPMASLKRHLSRMHVIRERSPRVKTWKSGDGGTRYLRHKNIGPLYLTKQLFNPKFYTNKLYPQSCCQSRVFSTIRISRHLFLLIQKCNHPRTRASSPHIYHCALLIFLSQEKRCTYARVYSGSWEKNCPGKSRY